MPVVGGVMVTLLLDGVIVIVAVWAPARAVTVASREVEIVDRASPLASVMLWVGVT